MPRNNDDLIEAATNKDKEVNINVPYSINVRHSVDIDDLLGFALILGLAIIFAADPAMFWSMF
jgi:hypothetical protein